MYRVINLKSLIAYLFCVLILSGCSAGIGFEEETGEEDHYYRVCEIDVLPRSDEEAAKSFNAIWVSQFDMHPIYRDGSRQRSEIDYRILVEAMCDNLVRDGFNVIILQVRPNGDSMYESEFYSNSKYIAGVYGGDIEYDAIEIFLDIARSKNLSVHAWLNPFRLCREDELLDFGSGIIYDWYREGIGKRIELGGDGLLYLDPSYEEATELIVSGVREILGKYGFDGIHLDDYFYPTEFEFDDDYEFSLSGYGDKQEFRKENVNKTVRALYSAVHNYEGKVFGVAPAGNIYSLELGWGVDIYEWLSAEGYVDYIMPQLYFGFQNETCPFDKVFKDWSEALKNKKIKLYVGLSAAKCELGSKGEADAYAGENGKYEWRDSKDILKRSYEHLLSGGADGVCIFTYSSFYDPISSEDNELTSEEHAAFCGIIKK
jgi:uncharacterized lipoprotein YddW (UPF0748 family)